MWDGLTCVPMLMTKCFSTWGLAKQNQQGPDGWAGHSKSCIYSDSKAIFLVSEVSQYSAKCKAVVELTMSTRQFAASVIKLPSASAVSVWRSLSVTLVTAKVKEKLTGRLLNRIKWTKRYKLANVQLHQDLDFTAQKNKQAIVLTSSSAMLKLVFGVSVLSFVVLL